MTPATTATILLWFSGTLLWPNHPLVSPNYPTIPVKKIFIVDDDIAMVRLYEMHMRRANLASYCFQNGQSAMQSIEKIAPDLIILDFDLPDIKGLELIHLIRAIESLKETPIITVTGQGKVGLKNDLLAAGAREVYTKPFSPALLLKAVQGLLSGK